ncbi:MAG: membrane protein insertase YidC, partial [Elusimicrobiota bacterium]|nr:membrane protein insertase YidC [Elusimicrobiota bacterium]
MQKRLIIAVGLSMFILVLFQQFQGPATGPAGEGQETASQENAVDKRETINRTEKEPEGKVEKKPGQEREKTQPGNGDLDSLQAVEISAHDLTLTLNNSDSGLTSLVMIDKDGSEVELVRDKVLDLYPLFLDAGVEGKWDINRIGEGTARAEISDGAISAVRIYRISGDDRINIENRVKNISGSSRRIELRQGWPGGLGTTENLRKENYGENKLFAKIDNKVIDKLKEESYEGQVNWGGVLNRYFIVSFLDIDDLFVKVRGSNIGGRSAGCGSSVPEDAEFPGIIFSGSATLNKGEEYRFNQEVYAGLKEYKVLKELNEDMDEVLSFGIFGFLSRIFLSILIWFESLVGNYGVAIIILTFLLQIIIFPLTKKSFKSMQAMKDLQPKMTSIREKFKDDPQRMNQEIMVLYKKHKVNPFGGCLPLLLQMPIFISLFTMLRSVAELRYAGFLWIHNLARQDVLFASIPVIKDIPFIGGAGPLPFLMGGAMFLQQKMTGGTEGSQKNLTYIMPVMFTFLFMKFPSGLVLYWL